MEHPTIRKTFKYKLTPTPEQEQAMEFVLRRCRELYNAALQERRDAWQKCGVSVTLAQQSAQLPAIKVVRPENRDIHSQVLQDVLARLDRAFQAFFRRVQHGSTVPNPRVFHLAEMNLRRAQRRVARRRTGSRRRTRAVKLLARVHQRVRRTRTDFHHKTALALVRAYDTIYHEDLQVANMLRNHHLAKAIADAGWAQFVGILAFKAAYAGKRAIAVPPAYTSQACSGCGVLVQKGLSVRWHRCPKCGASPHRDHNAARNILRLGRERSAAGQAVQASTWPLGASVA